MEIEQTFVYQSVGPVCLCIYLSIYLRACLPVYLSVYLYCMSVCMPVYQSVGTRTHAASFVYRIVCVEGG